MNKCLKTCLQLDVKGLWITALRTMAILDRWSWDEDGVRVRTTDKGAVVEIVFGAKLASLGLAVMSLIVGSLAPPTLETSQYWGMDKYPGLFEGEKPTSTEILWVCRIFPNLPGCQS